MTHTLRTTAGTIEAEWFITLDEAPIAGHPTPKYCLMEGDPDTACGFHRAEGRTIKALVAQVPPGVKVYRVYLARTEGKEGKRLLKR